MDEKVFDVSRPHKVPPDATSKPIIVGHHPEMVDPMVRDRVPQKPLPPIDIGPASDTDVPSVENTLSAGSKSSIPVGDTISPSRFEDSGLPPPQDINLSTEPPASSTPAGQLAKPAASPHLQSWHPDDRLPIPAPGGAYGRTGLRKKLPLILAGAVILLLAAYSAVDAGLIGNSINLPVHIFKQEKSAPEASTASDLSPAPVPSGSVNYVVADTDISFDYPRAWGTATVTADTGFTKRGGTNQSDGQYAYLVNFAANKNVQIVATSSQYLSAARSALYYDYQQWCTGSADGKFYKGLLRFVTTAGVDSPTTAACDQGPLTDAVKLNSTTIFQQKTKNPDDSSLGDLYTKNLESNDLPVLRVKDAASTSSEDIKKLLNSVQG